MDLPRVSQLHNYWNSSGKVSWYLFSFHLDNRNNVYKVLLWINILSYVCANTMVLMRLFPHGILFLAVLTAFIAKNQIKGGCGSGVRKPTYVFIFYIYVDKFIFHVYSCLILFRSFREGQSCCSSYHMVDGLCEGSTKTDW